jgi:predicted enzyme related to lactoylglutathione lyase
MTPDAEASRSFYGDLFGWTAEVGSEEFGGYFNFHRDGEPIAGGMPNNDPNTPNGWSVYLASDDAQATVDKVAANGGQVLVPPMPVGDLGTMAVLIDAGQASIGVWQPGLHKGFTVIGEANSPAWFELHTRAYEASVRFYENVFGWNTHVASDEPTFRYTTFGEGEDQHAGIMDASAMLPEGVPSRWSIYFGVEDTDKAVARVAELGGSTVRAPEDSPYGRLAEVADPTGATFKLVDGV